MGLLKLPLDRNLVEQHLKHILKIDTELLSEAKLTLFISELEHLIRQEEEEEKELNEHDEDNEECSCECCVEPPSEPVQRTERSSQPRPSSSFIKPWRLNAPGNSSGRSDPVQLFQRYQEGWKKNRVPGETGHARVRWAVRERMLGQDPQPRPSSRSSGLDSQKR